MNETGYFEVTNTIETIYRQLAILALDQSMGYSLGQSFSDIVAEGSILVDIRIVNELKEMAFSEDNHEKKERIERALMACMDITLELATSSLSDMLRFYMDKGRMIVRGQKIPALEIVPWLQKQDDYQLREEMTSELGIFSRAILNPMFLSILDTIQKTVTEKFGFSGYTDYAQFKRNSSFDEWQTVFTEYLSNTDEVYYGKVSTWVEARLGHPLETLNRSHTLRLMRIDAYDEYFPGSSLKEIVARTVKGLGLDLKKRKDIIIDIKDDARRNSDAICVPVDIPGEIRILVKPIGGIVDMEALLHEMGHAYFVSGFSRETPVEYRRLTRSPALDEAFAFLFMQLLENSKWLTDVARLAVSDAEKLVEEIRMKRLLLIRLHIGKFLAEKDLFESRNFKDSSFYCTWLQRATGFKYEPDGYLLDMEPEFYSAEYVWGWAGAEVLRRYLEGFCGENWYEVQEAGSFLTEISSDGRQNSLKQALSKFCGAELTMPSF
ncbi:MAG: hypothetical protein V1897_06310 [Pseudomonadota bacterium]